MPKRRHNTPPKYPSRPHRNKQARITYKGRDYYLGPHGSEGSYARYQEFLAWWRTQQATGKGTPPPLAPGSGLTVTDLVARFLTHAETYYRDLDGQSTAELAQHRAGLRPLLRLLGSRQAADVGPRDLRDYLTALVTGSWMTPEERAKWEAQGRPIGLARKPANQHLGRVKRMWRWGVAEELLDAACWQRLASVEGLKRGRTAAREHPPVEPVPFEAVRRTLEHLSHTLQAMVVVQLWSGMRPGEVCRLTAGEIDRDSLKVDGKPVWVYRPQRHKTAWRGHHKAVVLGPRAQEALGPYLEGRGPDEPVFSPLEALAEHQERRSANRTAKQSRRRRKSRGARRKLNQSYSVDRYGKAVARACRRAGVEPWQPNQLRHTAATLIREQYGLEAAQTVLGHSDPQTTLIYAERALSKAAEIAAAIG
jgi:integrase